MKVKIVTRSCEIKQHEHDYIVKKMENLAKFHINIDHVDVIVKKEGHQYVLELILKALHKDFMIKKKCSSVDEVIDILVDKMGQHLVKHKEKVKDHRKTKINVEATDELSELPYTLVYRGLDSFEKMSKQDAAYQVSHGDEKILIYIDLYTEKLSVAILHDHEIEIVES